MRTSELLRERFGLEDTDDSLLALDRLAGQRIGLNAFYEDAQWARHGQTAAYLLTRYFFPIADCAEHTVGLHLLPAYVAQGRWVVAQFDPESERLIDVAGSIRAYLHRVLLESEVEGKAVGAGLKVALGEDFYPAGPPPAEDVEQAMIAAYGGAALDYRDLAWMAGLRKADHERVAWLKRGVAAAPECLYLHWELARWHAQQGEFAAAAQRFARSLACHHHTGYGVRCGEYYTLGRELLEKVPAAFSNTARQDLTLDDGAARMRWLVSLFQAEEVATSVKLLSDFRYDSGTDLHPLLFAFLRRHYKALGWTWAVAWCDLCAMDEDDERAEYVYRGRRLPESWDKPLRAALG